MNASKPLVSVIVPAWNAAATLRETLRSVSQQTYANLEILVVDDGSSDETAAVAQEFCQSEPRARLIRKENGGVASARNRGIEEARGEWVAPIDADDLWHPTKIEKQLGAAVSAPEPPGLVYCWYRVIDEHGKVVGSGPRRTFVGRAFNRIAYRNPVENGSSLLILRSAALGVGGYDSSLREEGAQGCEDVMIQLRIARDYPVAAVPEYLVGYRARPDSMSGDRRQILRSWTMVYERIDAEARLPHNLMRWYRADVYATMAEDSAMRGRFADASTKFAKALLLDPVRWGTYLVYRAARMAVRSVRGARPGPDPLPFDRADPTAFIPRDADELRSLRHLLDLIDAGRLRRLALCDQRYR